MMTVEQLIRYIVEPKKKQAVSVKPPFLRPDLSERQITVKISDNGIQANLNRSKVRQPSSTSFEEHFLNVIKPGNNFIIENLLEIMHLLEKQAEIESLSYALSSESNTDLITGAFDPATALWASFGRGCCSLQQLITLCPKTWHLLVFKLILTNLLCCGNQVSCSTLRKVTSFQTAGRFVSSEEYCVRS